MGPVERGDARRQARRARLRRPRPRRHPRARRRAGDGRRHDRRGRRVRRRVPARRLRDGARRGGTLCRAAWERCRDDPDPRGDEVAEALRRRTGRWSRSRRRSSRTASPLARGRRGRARSPSGACARRARSPRPSASSTASVRVGLDGGRAAPLRRPPRASVGPRDLAACGGPGRGRRDDRRRHARRRASRRDRFMGTGGLGGVHRGWPAPPDVSADLGELARSEVLVVSSGVKSLLDVPVDRRAAGDARRPGARLADRQLPLFYAARGGPPVSARVESADEAARVARAHWQLGRARRSCSRGRPPRASRTSSR